MAATTSTFLSTLQTAPHDFLQPSLPLYIDAVAYLKNILDPLASQVSHEQQQRLTKARKKRKRGQDVPDENVLRLKQIHTDGLGVEQVWEQAKRVIDAARDEAEREYEQVRLLQNVQDARSGEDEDIDDESLGEEGVDYEIEGVDGGEDHYDEEDDEDDDEGLEDQILEDDDEEDFDMNGHDDYDDLEDDDGEHEDNEPAAEYVADKFGLNDGFFSIDDFNKQSEFLEQRDARGDNDGAASDEEDVDWDADPLAQAVPDAQASRVDAEDDVEDNEDGPTFGDPDAPSEEEDEEMGDGELDAMGGMGNTNEIMYADFFAPPAQVKKKNKKGRPNPHNFPAPSARDKEEDVEEEMERTMAAVHRDLFDESDEEEDEEGEELDPGDPRSRRSTHERRKAELQEEIRKLEAANVAKREWTLSGEARAADRPVNSLLEEDLDFERAGKPVAVITAEVSESIEELIKRRILAHDFQNVIRRRPDDLATGKDGRRGKLDFELGDGKSKKGLAEEYEEEHLRRTDPNFVDVKDEKLQKEQKEIESLWKEVCGQLDSLSSWHFRPKQPVPQLDIRVDAPAVTMEDARPTAGGDVAGASQLAPQEVYKAGEAADKRQEVVGKSGLPAGREELSREERKRRRRREKERIRKAGTNDNEKTESRAAKEKKNILGDLKRGNVRVIGKKGTVTDVAGKNVRENGSGQGASRFKL